MKKTIKSSEVTSTPKSILTRHGILQQVRSDNGPQFDNVEFSYFAKEWGFKHTTSSPRFLPSNGEVERGVRNVKNLLSKERDPAKGLLAYRLTPLACKFSPAQLLMGRQIRNGVPVFHTQLNPQWPDLENLRERASMSELKQRTVFNSSHKLVLLNQVRKLVFVKDLQRSGKVIEAAARPRSYDINQHDQKKPFHLTPLPDQQENHNQTQRRNKFQQRARLQHLFGRTFLFLRETFKYPL